MKRIVKVYTINVGRVSYEVVGLKSWVKVFEKSEVVIFDVNSKEIN